MAYQFTGRVKTLSTDKKVEFNMDDIIRWGEQEKGVAYTTDLTSSILISGGFTGVTSNIFNFISAHSNERLCVEIEKNKESKTDTYKITKVTLLK